MSLKIYIQKGWLKPEATSKMEIANLLAIVERDYGDSAQEVTHDWQFGIAYNAALKLASILIRASGYKVKGQSHHMTIILLIPEFFGAKQKHDSDYLDTCRRKRNVAEYDCVGGVTSAEVKELREFIVEFKIVVMAWLKKNYPELL